MMAKFEVTYNVQVGDLVRFRTLSKGIEEGRVQCISELPDVFVEVNPPYDTEYKRYRIGVDMIIFNYTRDDWKELDYSFEDDEPIEFVYDDHYQRVVTSRYSKKEDKVKTITAEKNSDK